MRRVLATATRTAQLEGVCRQRGGGRIRSGIAATFAAEKRRFCSCLLSQREGEAESRGGRSRDATPSQSSFVSGRRQTVGNSCQLPVVPVANCLWQLQQLWQAGREGGEGVRYVGCWRRRGKGAKGKGQGSYAAAVRVGKRKTWATNLRHFN